MAAIVEMEQFRAHRCVAEGSVNALAEGAVAIHERVIEIK
jgi:hypothetical protein